MTALEIYERCLALKLAMSRTRIVDEAATLFAEINRLFDGQCMRCSQSEDDPTHQPQPRRWRKPRPPECPYVPRVPAHLRSIQSELPEPYEVP